MQGNSPNIITKYSPTHTIAIAENVQVGIGRQLRFSQQTVKFLANISFRIQQNDSMVIKVSKNVNLPY